MKLNTLLSRMLLTVALLAAAIGMDAANVAKHVFVFHNGQVVFMANANELDSIALEDNKTVISLYKRDGTMLYSAPYTDVDSITTKYEPKADLLDVVFTANGSAVDVSPMQNQVDIFSPDDTLETVYNETYKTYEAHISNPWGQSGLTSYCRVDYEGNDEFMNALADGHSIETLFKCTYSGTIQNAEAKWFSSMQGGGTGFLVSKTATGRQNELTFLPNVYPGASKNNWIWCNSGVVPESGVYYHVVGVWDKDAKKARIYVNGELKKEIDADGDFRFPSAGCKWFCIGGDPKNATTAEAGGDWNIVRTRIYDKVLTDADVAGLWDGISEVAEAPTPDLLDIVFHEDGTAEDVSPMKNPVETVASTDGVKPTTYYNANFKTYVAKFENAFGAKPANYYKVDYSNNEQFMAALQDGHTLETTFKAKYATLPNVESKWFSSMQAGGTGFLLCKQANGGGKQSITFLPNVSTTGKSTWIWCTSDTVPQSDVYYHVVGVWNKEEGKAYIYINGELCKTVDAAGELKLPANGAKWWCIGGDSKADGTAEAGGNWEVVTARAYDKPLNAHDVYLLWNNVRDELIAATDSVAHANALADTSVVAPKADLLDVVFNADGTATDVSAMQNDVQTFAGPGLVTYYNPTYKRYVANFSNAWGGAVTGYYKVDYTDNQAFKDSLSAGHTIETIFMPEYSGAIPNSEAKWFSSHQGGGTGFLISNISGERKNEITFLPNITTTGSSNWIWCTSSVVPESHKYYHVVGVWNKKEGKVYIYVNGQLKNVMDAPGELKYPSSGSTWFGIGCDPSGNNPAQGWVGDVVEARIYGHALSTAEVGALWRGVDSLQQSAVPDMVTNVSFISGYAVKAGSPYAIDGSGFQSGDQIELAPTFTGDAAASTLEVTLNGTQGVTVTLPAGLATGKYRITLKRGDAVQILGITSLQVVEELPAGSQVIAHRGYWNVEGAAQNSVASLKNAIAKGYYGSECDIWLTADDADGGNAIMVNHDASFNGVTLETSTYEQCKDLTLSNGEKMPRLEDFLELIKPDDVKTKLIIEIKQHSDATRSEACAAAATQAVADAGVAEKVEYISFSLDVCKAIVALEPKATVAYLSSNKDTALSPAELQALGIKGLDYSAAVYRAHPTWIQEAKELGMTTNVWTLDSTADILEFNNANVGFITTNNPVEATNIANYYSNQK